MLDKWFNIKIKHKHENWIMDVDVKSAVIDGGLGMGGESLIFSSEKSYSDITLA